jgi:hypothetical protein
VTAGYFLLVQPGARALVATAAGACLADHGEILSRPAPVEVTAARAVTTNPKDPEDHGRAKAGAAEAATPAVQLCFQVSRARAITRPCFAWQAE